MDRDNTIKRDTNPREKANFLSLVTFFYTLKLYLQGYTKGIELDDIYEVLSDTDSKDLGDDLEHQWQKQIKKEQKPSICRSLWYSYGKNFISIGIAEFVTTLIATTWSPKALSKLISYFSPQQTDLTKNDAIFYACLVISINLINSVIRFNFTIILTLLGIKAKAALSSLVYRKSLKLSPKSLSDVTAGKIVTVITTDSDMVAFFTQSNNFWVAIIKTFVICYLIFQQIGVISFGGITFFLIVLPFQIFLGTLTYRYKLKCSRKTDERLNMIREVLAASKIIKMYTWEKFFEEKIHDAREAEMEKLHKYYYSRVWITVIGSVCSKTAFFIFLMTYIWKGHNVTAETVYFILSCFDDLESSLSNDIPFGVSQFAQLFVTATRVENVLEAEELPLKHFIQSKQPRVVFEDVDVTIDETKILENVSITISDGLNIVMGHMGNGKTTFLKAILNEYQTIGDISVNGSVSYASQEPWLFPSTIKNNILFGEDFDEIRYREVLKVCALDYDLQLLPKGDNTVVGESGVNLSKGQQARINLARAAYKNSDIYLLDDCLASLDGHVSDMIFKNCICEFLNNKIRIFVSNNLEHVRAADQVIVINSRCVKFQNSYKDKQMDKMYKGVDNVEERLLEEKNADKYLYHEGKKSGAVPLRDYHRYIKYGGGVVVFGLIVGLFVLTQSATSYSDKLLSNWISLEQNVTNYKQFNETDTPEYDVLSKGSTHELVLYTVMAATAILLSVIRSFSFFYFVRTASINIHKAMVHSIVNSTMNFFDSHFIGNVLNRCIKDYVTLDYGIPFVAMNCLTMIFTIFGGIVLLTNVNYIFLLECLVLLVAACAWKQFCQPTGRNLERLLLLARGPLSGHVNSTLEGLTTIRTSKAKEIVKYEFDRHQNLFTSAVIMVWTNYIALSFYMKLICSVFTSAIIFQCLFLNLGSTVGDVGLAITQAFVITNIISTGISNIADFENLMVAAERILEYTELEEEVKTGKILFRWPKIGSISFNNVSLTYGNTNILKNVTFSVDPNEKVGIIGRTGAGKSSIISSLFRLYPTHGEITIDGTNIEEVSLPWLRSNISVIPQDPYLFPGTIRENLDPLKLYQDDQIWQILKELRLDNLIHDLNHRIDKGVTLSSGQKQLLCLARVILRKNKIVILDEATAHVDDETENLMQEALRKHFSNCTMLIIAHKSSAVSKCCRIIVMSNGRVKEILASKNLQAKTLLVNKI